MTIFDPAPSPWPSRMLSVLRIVSGAVFITFGTMKLFNVPPMPPDQPPVELMSQVGIAGIVGATPAILYCFVFLYFVFSGAGVWSIDAMIARSRANRI